MKRLFLALAAALVIAGCGGSGGGNAATGSEADCEGCAAPTPQATPQVARCGGDASVACRDGLVCVPDPAVTCDALDATGCEGTCQPPVDPKCDEDADCAGIARCFHCPGGPEICPTPFCVDGICLMPVPDCPRPPDHVYCGGLLGTPCPDGQMCIDDPDSPCANGMAADCEGICVPKPFDRCSNDSECPVLGAPCILCDDGSSACPRSYCDNGQCSVSMDTCSEAKFCGGIAGFPCKPGYECIDDPADDCDPANGGADCGGVCVPDDRPVSCGGFAGTTCPEGLDCFDDPRDDCRPTEGGADCPGVCRPVFVPECESNLDCPQLRAPCSVCPDGTAACPSSTCDGGRCNVIFPPCAPPLGCVSDEECKEGYYCGYDPLVDCFPDPTVPCPRTCLPSETLGECGGIAGVPCPEGFTCKDDPRDGCRPDMSGADCPGICEPEQVPQCDEDSDCPALRIACIECPDRSTACPKSWCEEGQCRASFEGCGPGPVCGGFAGIPCDEGFECIDNPRDNCDPADGGADCGGICVPKEIPPPRCESDADCPTDLGCALCPDNSLACPKSWCEEGLCRQAFQGCPPGPFCGGSEGTPCPEGFDCIDNPRDGCEPVAGHTVCGGFCVPREVPPPKCASDADCAIPLACLMCPDGTAACPHAECIDGLCRGEAPVCPPEFL